jgi:hypothetical protein
MHTGPGASRPVPAGGGRRSPGGIRSKRKLLVNIDILAIVQNFTKL